LFTCLPSGFAAICRSYQAFKSKLRPCGFALAAAAKALFRLAARNASYAGVTSCHAFRFRIKNGDISIWKWNDM
jgi:hypothetical protein